MSRGSAEKTRSRTLFVEQLHSRSVFWRIRGGPPGGGADSAGAAAGGAAAEGLGAPWQRGNDNLHDLMFWRIRTLAVKPSSQQPFKP